MPPNKIAVERMLAAHPVLVDVQPARDVIPALQERRLLHAGPPINWERMCGPMRGAVIGACIYEGWAKDEAEAVAMAQSGALDFEPCHHYNAVGPMAVLPHLRCLSSSLRIRHTATRPSRL